MIDRIGDHNWMMRSACVIKHNSDNWASRLNCSFQGQYFRMLTSSFALSVLWHWSHLYKKAVSEKMTKMSKTMNVPKECSPGKVISIFFTLLWHVFTKPRRMISSVMNGTQQNRPFLAQFCMLFHAVFHVLWRQAPKTLKYFLLIGSLIILPNKGEVSGAARRNKIKHNMWKVVSGYIKKLTDQPFCTPADSMTWSEYFAATFTSSDKCREYHEAVLINPIIEVS